MQWAWMGYENCMKPVYLGPLKSTMFVKVGLRSEWELQPHKTWQLVWCQQVCPSVTYIALLLVPGGTNSLIRNIVYQYQYDKWRNLKYKLVSRQLRLMLRFSGVVSVLFRYCDNLVPDTRGWCICILWWIWLSTMVLRVVVRYFFAENRKVPKIGYGLVSWLSTPWS